jgi:hypothetical protein
MDTNDFTVFLDGEDKNTDEGPILDESVAEAASCVPSKLDEIIADIEACRELDNIGIERIVFKYVMAAHYIKGMILDYQRVQDQRRAAVASEVAAKAEETGKKLTQAEIDRAISVDEQFVEAKSVVAAAELALTTLDRAIRIFERIAERA